MFNLFYRYDVDSASRNLKDHVSTKLYFVGPPCKVCGLCTCNIHVIIHTKSVISCLITNLQVFYFRIFVHIIVGVSTGAKPVFDPNCTNDTS